MRPPASDLRPILLQALRTAPRRYRLPPLPASVNAAAGLDAETRLAYAIESARNAHVCGHTPAEGVAALFLQGLADLIREALAPGGGDAAFQARVLQAQDAEVAEYVRLAATSAHDRRSVMAVVDALGHPGKRRGADAGGAGNALGVLHGHATADAWANLQAAASALADDPAQLGTPPDTRRALQALHDGEALARLVRGASLCARPAVQHYQRLLARQGPAAGSEDASALGRAAADAGNAAEHAAAEAFERVARLLQPCTPASLLRVRRSLRTPTGFPGAAPKTKDEWDVALLADPAGGGAAQAVLLAEVKAAPAAATSDYARLVRGLQRLAQADAGVSYTFDSADGEVAIAGDSLRRLAPAPGGLPPHVIYCCCAPAETRPLLLNAATRAVLLVEPESLAYAARLQRRDAVSPDDLAPVWHALTREPRLRSALHQDETARAARDAILHPDDLVEAVARALAGGG
jgi:hypothetical protein